MALHFILLTAFLFSILLMKQNVLHDDSAMIVLIGSIPRRAFDYTPLSEAQALTLERNDSTIPSMTYGEKSGFFSSTCYILL